MAEIAHRPARARARRRDEAPSRHTLGRVLFVGLAVVAIGVGGYALARGTSLFAVRSIEVRGAPPSVVRQVVHALAPLVGRSLVGLDDGAVLKTVGSLPAVARASVDRSFPHTLRVVVVPERPVAVLRAGTGAWLVSARARVVRSVPRDARPSLPRIWESTSGRIAPGGVLAPTAGGDAAHALAQAAGFPYAIRAASSLPGELVFTLASGIELRLGTPGDIRLKLAVATRALRRLPAGTRYLDVALPGRPVSGSGSGASNSQVSGGA